MTDVGHTNTGSLLGNHLGRSTLGADKQELERAIAFFEQLDEVVRDAVLDQVEGKLSKMEKVRFTAARKGNAAHKERTYAFHFKQVLIEKGFEVIQ